MGKRFSYIYIKSRHLINKYVPLKLENENYLMCGEKINRRDDDNNYIRQLIESGNPLSIIRPGLDEMGFLALWDEHCLFGTKRYKKMRAGKTLYYDEEKIVNWCELYKKVLRSADIIAVQPRFANEEYMIKNYCDGGRLIHIDHLNPLSADDPWLSSLSGRKVLIVTAFVEEMKQQYERKNLLWGNRNVLPDMDVDFLKAPWYVGGLSKEKSPYDDWFDAYDELRKNVLDREFDVALLCCSAFGTILTREIKDMGRQGIQMGGDFQLLFGIKGARWDDNSSVNKYFNEYWIRPFSKPKSGDVLDGGCYY